jgi:hypothetical protein
MPRDVSDGIARQLRAKAIHAAGYQLGPTELFGDIQETRVRKNRKQRRPAQLSRFDRAKDLLRFTVDRCKPLLEWLFSISAREFARAHEVFGEAVYLLVNLPDEWVQVGVVEQSLQDHVSICVKKVEVYWRRNHKQCSLAIGFQPITANMASLTSLTGGYTAIRGWFGESFYESNSEFIKIYGEAVTRLSTHLSEHYPAMSGQGVGAGNDHLVLSKYVE